MLRTCASVIAELENASNTLHLRKVTNYGTIGHDYLTDRCSDPIKLSTY